jgi:hypothetical protein
MQTTTTNHPEDPMDRLTKTRRAYENACRFELEAQRWLGVGTMVERARRTREKAKAAYIEAQQVAGLTPDGIL